MRASAMATLLVWCGCSVGGGTLSLEITDAPPDKDQMSEVIITLARVDAHVVDKSSDRDGDPHDDSIDADSSWHSAVPARREYDLLRLQNDTRDALADLDLPAGKITQIRLVMDPLGRNAVILKDGRSCALDLRGTNAQGIKINHPFKAIGLEPGARVNVVIDFDLMESISQDGDCAYSLKPVIKIKGSPVRRDKMR